MNGKWEDICLLFAIPRFSFAKGVLHCLMRSLSVLFLLLVATASFAQVDKNLLPGKWKGGVEVVLDPKMEKQLTPQQKKQMVDQMKKTVVNLMLGKDGSYSADANINGKPDKTTGTWALSGKTITFTDTKRNGKAIEKGKQQKQTMTVVSVSKSALRLMPPSPGVKVYINLKRV